MRAHFKHLLAAVLLVAGCGSENGAPDATAGSEQRPPDGSGGLYPCTEPGRLCNAHDSCAIDPICGPDYLCHPQGKQNCDDGLDCTTDTCLGQGACENTPKQGYCVLAVAGQNGGPTTLRCFASGDSSPDKACRQCSPDKNPLSWSPVTGTACDDENPCTKDDVCTDGFCRGKSYSCSDSLTCTDDTCDGKGGCNHLLKAGSCLIDKTCYSDQQGDATNCNICDVSTSTSQWTPLGNSCKIAGYCHATGDKTPDGCNVCDPQKNASGWSKAVDVCRIDGACYADKEAHAGAACAVCELKEPSKWTVLGGQCLIAGTCHASGAADPSGCQTCDPTQNPLDWSPTVGRCFINGNCYTAGDKHPLACAECDPISNRNAWTVKGPYCLIDDFCYLSGVQSSTACYSECDPAKSTTSWTDVGGRCQIDGACYQPGALDATGCAECSPSVSLTEWTVLSGNCQIDGVCYQAGDKDTQKTCRQCDPTSSNTEWSAIPGSCFIDDTCYQDGDKHPLACAECVSSNTRDSWTVTGQYCLIDNLCYLPGALQPAGCGTCDPLVDHYDWTPPAGQCLIGGKCIADGSKDATGCRICDTSQSLTDWTPIAGCVVTSQPLAVAAGGGGADGGYDVAIDRSYNLYITGWVSQGATFEGTTLTSYGGSDIVVAKLAPTGALEWAVTAGGSGSDSGASIAVDSYGNAYVTGYFSGTATFGTKTATAVGSRGVFVTKISPQGKFLWVASGGSSKSDLPRGIDVDAGGASYVTGYSYAGTTFGSHTLKNYGNSDIFVAKLSTNGQFVWATAAGGSSSDVSESIAVDRNGNSYIAGRFALTASFDSVSVTAKGSYDGLVAKLSPQGKFLWATSTGGTSSDSTTDIRVNQAGDLFVTGYFSGSATLGSKTVSSSGSYDVLIAKLSSAGTPIWLTSAGGASNDQGWGLGVDRFGDAYVAGIFRSTAKFGTHTVTAPSSSYAAYGAKVSGIDGKFHWAQSGGSTSSDYVYGADVDGTGLFAVVGYFSGAATFGTTSLTPVGGSDLFVWKMAPPSP